MRSFIAVIWGLSVASYAGAAQKHRSYVSQGWNIVESENFRVCSRGPIRHGDSILRATEAMRQELTRQWLGSGERASAWSPKCDVVLHSTAAAYVKAVPGGEQTVGSSLINTAAGEVVGRRIDIRADRAGWLDAALAHELTHVVLADHFADGRLPAWADEGMAVLADTNAKQDAHYRDLRAAQSLGSAFRLVELFALDGYPSPGRQAAFYGQSASLVRYLLTRGNTRQFIQFVGAAATDGYDSAARSVYGLQGIAELERRWLQDVRTSEAVATNWSSRWKARTATVD